jgi:hypothetical protein
LAAKDNSGRNDSYCHGCGYQVENQVQPSLETHEEKLSTLRVFQPRDVLYRGFT